MNLSTYNLLTNIGITITIIGIAYIIIHEVYKEWKQKTLGKTI